MTSPLHAQLTASLVASDRERAAELVIRLRRIAMRMSPLDRDRDDLLEAAKCIEQLLGKESRK